MSSTSEPKPSSPSAAFEAALTRTAADSRGADPDLVEAVRDMDVAGESATALDLLAARPRVVLRLDEAVRRTAERRYEYAPRSGQGEELLAADLSPLGVALASCHPDGRVRRRAVGLLQELLGRPQAPATLMPFLVLRTADWAQPVRDHARGALAVLLHDQPKQLVPAAAPLTLLVSRRERGSFARQQRLGALASEPGAGAFDQLLAAVIVAGGGVLFALLRRRTAAGRH